jgi:hypothetical protein
MLTPRNIFILTFWPSFVFAMILGFLCRDPSLLKHAPVLMFIFVLFSSSGLLSMLILSSRFTNKNKSSPGDSR